MASAALGSAGACAPSALEARSSARMPTQQHSASDTRWNLLHEVRTELHARATTEREGGESDSIRAENGRTLSFPAIDSRLQAGGRGGRLVLRVLARVGRGKDGDVGLTTWSQLVERRHQMIEEDRHGRVLQEAIGGLSPVTRLPLTPSPSALPPPPEPASEVVAELRKA